MFPLDSFRGMSRALVFRGPKSELFGFWERIREGRYRYHASLICHTFMCYHGLAKIELSSASQKLFFTKGTIRDK